MDSDTRHPIGRPAPQNGTRTALRLRRLRPADVAIISVTLVLFGMGITALSRGGSAPLSQVTPEHVEMLAMVDTGAQRLSHRVGLMLLAALSLAGIALTRSKAGATALSSMRFVGVFSGLAIKLSGILVISAAATVLLLRLQGMNFGGNEGRGFRLILWGVSVCLTLCALGAANRLTTRAFAVATWACVVSYIIVLVLPGFTHSPSLLEPLLLSRAEWHYSATLAQGDRLAAGLSLGREITPSYGLIPPVALAFFERTAGLLNFGNHIRLVQASQLAFLATAVIAYFLWRPGNPLFILFATLLVGPWLSTIHSAVYHPNQAGWRSFGFAVGVVLLLLMRGQPPCRAALILGGGAAFLMLFNPETGLCLSFGYALFVVSRLRDFKAGRAGVLAARAGVGAAITLLAFLILYRAGLGEWPVMKPTAFLGFITRFAQGYGGLPLYFDPLALIIFVHCAFIVAFTAMRWGRRNLEFDESVRFAVAAAILIWYAYFVNRPHPWNLWTHQFLYAFLIADFLDPRRLAQLRRRGVMALADVRLAVLTFILLPAILSTNNMILRETLKVWRGPGYPTASVSGVLLPEPTARALRAKADVLARQDPASTLYFTRNSYSLSLLTGIFIRLPVQDVFAETITNEDFERLVGEVERMSPRTMLFDAAETEAAAAQNPNLRFYAHFYDRLKARLTGRYQPAGVTQGWEVWALRSR